jgi:hypothetical protein
VSDAANAIVAALTREDEDGNGVYSSDEIRHALPYLAVSLELPLAELSDGMQALVAAALADAGGTVEGLRAYYDAHPVNAHLLDDVRRALEGDGISATDRRAADVIGAPATPALVAPPKSDGPKERLAACATALAGVATLKLKGPRVEATLVHDDEDARARVKSTLHEAGLVLPIAWRTA